MFYYGRTGARVPEDQRGTAACGNAHYGRFGSANTWTGFISKADNVEKRTEGQFLSGYDRFVRHTAELLDEDLSIMLKLI